MNDFDDWNQTEMLVKHLLMTQLGLIFSAASTPDGTAVRSTAFTVAGTASRPSVQGRWDSPSAAVEGLARFSSHLTLR